MKDFDPAAVMASAMDLVDKAMLEGAEDALSEAQLRHREAETAAMAAEADLEEARAAMPKLVEAGATGELASARIVAKVYAAVQDAQNFAAYFAAVVRRRAETVEHAHAVLRDARHVAHLPMLHHGQDLRIQAGVLCDAAKRFTGHLTSGTPLDEVEAANARRKAAVDAAQPLWDAGSRIIDAACRSGAQLPLGAGWIPDTWPTSEQAERRHWRRPLEVAGLEAHDAATA